MNYSSPARTISGSPLQAATPLQLSRSQGVSLIIPPNATAMEAPKKWSVVFTKHLKQKCKVFRDGFLSLHSSTAKAMLYDDSEQLLECGILKNDEVVSSGEKLTFNAYLVDVGEPEGGRMPPDDTCSHSREKKLPKRANWLHRNKFIDISNCAGIN